MQFRASLAAAASLLALANARIIGIAFPETVKAGDEVDAIVETENYIQKVEDIAIAFGISANASAFPKTLGRNELGSFYLGPDMSNILENITLPVTVPADLAHGKYVLAAGLYSLYGASHSTIISHYNVTITVSNSTSKSYVSSHR